MDMMRTLCKAVPLCALLLLMQSGNAFASVGKVLYRHGNVSIEKPAVSILRVGQPVDEGDVIVTGPKGYVQLLLDDSTKVAVRPDSRFIIVALEMPATTGYSSIGAGVNPKTEFSLQKGGFRTITGRIAEENPSSYEVSTPSAVIRVRGTNYIARLCQADCASANEDGLYVGVSNGAIYLANSGGELDLARNQFGYARNFNTQPVRLIAPPASLQDEGLSVLLEEEEEEEESEGDADADSDEASDESSESEEEAEDVAAEFGGDSEVGESDSAESATGEQSASEPDQEITAVTENGETIDLTDGTDIVTPQALAFSTEQNASGINSAAETLVFDDTGNLMSFDEFNAQGQLVTYRIGSSTTLNEGFDPLTQFKWGRWSEGIGEVSVDGSSSPLDLTTSSLHWVLAPLEEGPSQLITGSAEYVLVGNTDPTDNLGNIGVLGSASLVADFTNLSVTNNLQLSINSQVWQASGTGSIANELFSGLYSSVTINGLSGGSGSFGGGFSGFSELTPLGAGLNYHLTNDNGTSVNGAAIFNRTP